MIERIRALTLTTMLSSTRQPDGGTDAAHTRPYWVVENSPATTGEKTARHPTKMTNAHLPTQAETVTLTTDTVCWKCGKGHRALSVEDGTIRCENCGNTEVGGSGA